MAKKYIDNGFVTVIIDGKKVHTAFKVSGFLAPWVSEYPINVEEVIEKEAPLMENLFNAYRKNNEELIAEIEAQCILPALISGYAEQIPEDKTTGVRLENRLFDILGGKQFKMASIPDEAKADLSDENEKLAAENEALKSKLAQLEETAEPEDSEPSKTK